MRDEDSQAETYDGCGRQAGQARGRVTGSSTSRSHRLRRNPEPGNWPSDRRSNEARCADAHQIHGDGSGVCENPSDAADLARWKWIALVHRLPADLQCCTESRIGRDRLLSNCRYLRSVYSVTSGCPPRGINHGSACKLVSATGVSLEISQPLRKIVVRSRSRLDWRGENIGASEASAEDRTYSECLFVRVLHDLDDITSRSSVSMPAESCEVSELA